MLPVSFFNHMEEIKNLFQDREPILFLDYDGTLTPIVATPDMAVISDEMREQVSSLSKNRIVSIVSGRSVDDVRNKVGIGGIFYAGSHGFEILSPRGEVTVNAQAEQIRKTIDEIWEKLAIRVGHINGALIENVKYSVSCHYRLVADEDFSEFQKIVDETLSEYPRMMKCSGKKVFELRPKIDWGKGKAVEWILDYLQFDPDFQYPVYIGDDTTDEDAFMVLQNKGPGVLVADPVRESAARYVVHDVEDVKKVLEFFCSII
ncbi:MAG: trehalose-phosphatase [Candidatus Omnitrophota bacterium]